MSKIGNYVIAMEEEGNFFYNEKEKRYERRHTEKKRRSSRQGKDAASTTDTILTDEIQGLLGTGSRGGSVYEQDRRSKVFLQKMERCKRRGSKGVLNRKEQRSRKHYRRILLLGQEPRIRKLPINRRK